MAESIRFLSVADVLLIHSDTIAREGGSAGLRDPGLLEAAVEMPRQQFAGCYLHDGLFEMAGAYLFHLCANHPFVDGNKRTAAMSAVVFLDLNGVASVPEPGPMTDVTIRVAAGALEKPELLRWFRSLGSGGPG